MSTYPKIQSPCPYKGDLSAVMDGDMCRLCNRQVFNLSGMNDKERVAFMSGCSSQVCVSYKFPLKAAAAAAITLMALATPLAAAADPTSDDEAIIVVGGVIDLPTFPTLPTRAMHWRQRRRWCTRPQLSRRRRTRPIPRNSR